ncbi:hypothetical protein HBB16_04605 [Pseudonocardia sp. MCCB 268]|nr:hypothetical protein [Pseudonocardia cytotoxica]
MLSPTVLFMTLMTVLLSAPVVVRADRPAHPGQPLRDDKADILPALQVRVHELRRQVRVGRLGRVLRRVQGAGVTCSRCSGASASTTAEGTHTVLTPVEDRRPGRRSDDDAGTDRPPGRRGGAASVATIVFARRRGSGERVPSVLDVRHVGETVRGRARPAARAVGHAGQLRPRAGEPARSAPCWSGRSASSHRRRGRGRRWC